MNEIIAIGILGAAWGFIPPVFFLSNNNDYITSFLGWLTLNGMGITLIGVVWVINWALMEVAA